jgi:hypothetical protein
MSQDKTIPVNVVAFRAEDYSPDGKNVIISLTTKYSIADRKFSVPIECFHDLILDLQRLNTRPIGSCRGKNQTATANDPFRISGRAFNEVRDGTPSLFQRSSLSRYNAVS